MLENFGRKLFIGADVSEDLKGIADEANNKEFDNKSHEGKNDEGLDLSNLDKLSAMMS